MATRRKVTVESAVVEAVFTAVQDLCVRVGSGVLLAVQVVLAFSFVAAALVCVLMAAAWQSVHPKDRAALRRLPARVGATALALWRWLGRVQRRVTDVADEAVESVRREIDRACEARRRRGYRLATPAELDRLLAGIGLNREVHHDERADRGHHRVSDRAVGRRAA